MIVAIGTRRQESAGSSACGPGDEAADAGERRQGAAGAADAAGLADAAGRAQAGGHCDGGALPDDAERAEAAERADARLRHPSLGWSPSPERLTRKLAQQLAKSGCGSPEVAAALAALRARLGLDVDAFAARLRVPPTDVIAAERGEVAEDVVRRWLAEATG